MGLRSLRDCTPSGESEALTAVGARRGGCGRGRPRAPRGTVVEVVGKGGGADGSGNENPKA